ncbi:MAG: SIS domain-containing protein [Rhodobacteraceae bacterium]|nr:SIS domain-containing protein [Paracoccaceae bacterium]MYF45269.1 SIS domain-containing protein [Paracoccaceae bacterium]MYG10001.1 SIS domain-containing protein [Paracoccaceae bacterium]MYI91719.1 SIS domain-containing protein [Paracoccaceae bacterium]MYJ86282.1 SIS domain-containing protein [Paracoccaceae bacterium]
MNRTEQILDELRSALSPDVLAQIPGFAREISQSGQICCYGVGREGLIIKALVMRLYHLGFAAHVVGDMTTPRLGINDMLIVSAGPGNFSTVAALVDVARKAGSKVVCITSEPDGLVPLSADMVVNLPAQTMATTKKGNVVTSILPMGSLYEVIMFLFFELLVLEIRDVLGISYDDMSAMHTNLE